MLGWGLSSALICLSIAYNYQNYGGEYHCWLQVDSDLFTVQLVPIVILVILIFTMIEAAGNANLPGSTDVERTNEGGQAAGPKVADVSKDHATKPTWSSCLWCSLRFWSGFWLNTSKTYHCTARLPFSMDAWELPFWSCTAPATRSSETS